ncbi:MAG: hypothetical protein D6725_02655, partial [Planctomycetota bacterium]
PATSLRAETGRETDARSVLPDVLAAIGNRLRQWQGGGFQALRTDWSERCRDIGRTVRVTDADVGGTQRIGRVTGFGDAGELLLRAPDGRVLPVWSGDVLDWQPRW